MIPGTIDKRRILVLTAIIAIVILLLFMIIITFHPIGPGLPEHMDFSGAVIGNLAPLCASVNDTNSPKPEFCISQKNTGNYPMFPSLSPMAGYAMVRKPGTNETFVAAIWYFEHQDECATSEKELSQYLKSHGQVAPVALDLSQEIQSWKYTSRQISSPVLKGTAFEGNDTAGYFFVIKKAIMPTRDDCFIEYFGQIGKSDLSAGSSDLRYIIAWESNDWYLFSGQTGPLSENGEKRDLLSEKN